MAIPVLNARSFALPLLASLLLPFSASAGNFSYTWVEGSYSDISADDFDFDGDAWAIEGSFQVHDMVFLFAGYEMGDYDFDVETDTYELGVGMAFPFGEQADLVVGTSYVDVSVEIPGFEDADDDGYSLFGGFRYAVTDAFQVDAGLRYVDLSDSGDDTGYTLGGRYYFTPAWAVGAGYTISDDADLWTLSVRWEMPR